MDIFAVLSIWPPFVTEGGTPPTTNPLGKIYTMSRRKPYVMPRRKTHTMQKRNK